MNIEKWDMNRVLQLPGCCFGKRWIISVGYFSSVVATYYDISTAGLPDKCVVWSIFINFQSSTAARMIVQMALGMKKPANDAQFDAMNVLFKDLGVIVAGRKAFQVQYHQSSFVLDTKIGLESAGLKLVGRFDQLHAVNSVCCMGMVISSIPKEVPDWLISGLAGVR